MTVKARLFFLVLIVITTFMGCNFSGEQSSPQMNSKSWFATKTPVKIPHSTDFVAVDCSGKNIWIAGQTVLIRTNTDLEKFYVFQPKINSSIADIDFFNDQDGAIILENESVLLTHDGGKSWEKTRVRTQGNTALCYVNANTLLIGGMNGSIFRSTDGGKTWKVAKNAHGQPINQFAFENEKLGFALSDFTGLFATEDRGLTWREVTIPPSSLKFKKESESLKRGQYSLGLAVGKAGRLWLVGDFGTILTTPDDGKSWFNCSQSKDIALTGVAAVDTKSAVVGKKGTVLVTEDGGKSFKKGFFRHRLTC